jgi:hypothetical protein
MAFAHWCDFSLGKNGAYVVRIFIIVIVDATDGML